jgi:hypothetical protein
VSASTPTGLAACPMNGSKGNTHVAVRRP